MRILQGIVQNVQASSQLLPLLRSPFQGDLLAWLFLHPEDEYSTTDLANRFRVSPATASREADRLVEGNLISERRAGNLRLLRARVDTIVARPLTDLLAVTYGPSAVLSALLSGLAGIEEAHIYGSWAARYQGQPGPIPRDVDVLVVGDVDDDDLYDAARNAERQLGREVNIHRVAPEAWHGEGTDPFLASIRSRSLVALDLDRKQP